MFLRVRSLDETASVASAVADLSRPGDLIVLSGEMGAGKTAFAQAFGRALGVSDRITSPTFTLVHSYPTASPRVTLHHADLYRLDTTADVDDLALNELAEFGGIVLIEWGDVVAHSFGDHLSIDLSHDDEPDDEPGDESDDADESDEADTRDVDGFDDERRLITVDATGSGWAGRWDRLVSSLEGFRQC